MSPTIGTINADQPVRTKLVGYPGRMMLRDIKRRTLIRQYWPKRFRYQLLRKNMIFPESFKVRRWRLFICTHFWFVDYRITVERKNFQHSLMKLNPGGDGIVVH